MANLSYVTGVTVGSGFVRVGHNSGATNNDAVWSFTPTAAVNSAVFSLEWDNGAAGSGWRGEFNYVFAISISGAAGRTAATGSHTAKVVVTLSGSAGTATVKFSGLNLNANTTYYLRANQNGTTTGSMKAFRQSGNTVNYTASSLNLYFNKNAVTAVKYNGATVSSMKLNGTTIF